VDISSDGNSIIHVPYLYQYRLQPLEKVRKEEQ
jgi:hypothetical protein